mgnify:FL=1
MVACELLNKQGLVDKDDERLYFREEDSEGWRHRQNECYGSEYALYMVLYGVC